MHPRLSFPKTRTAFKSNSMENFDTYLASFNELLQKLHVPLFSSYQPSSTFYILCSILSDHDSLTVR